jgi:NADH-quinone oxidoreductase subunit E
MIICTDNHCSTGEPYILAEEDRAEIEHHIHHYDDARAASIDALKVIQRRHGWVPDGAIRPVANLLGISAPDLEGVATFYSLIFRRPVGRNVIKICDSIACHLMDYQKVQQAIEQQIGVGLGQTTQDDRYTLLPICCLGACDKAPVLMINDNTHFNVTPEQVPALLEAYE